jgi:hypothetical protein
LHERGADIFNENSVKDVISKQKWSDNRRRNVINAYDMFLNSTSCHGKSQDALLHKKFHSSQRSRKSTR